MLSSLGLFYLIIIALFAVPLLASFVVVLIKGVVDVRYAILIGGGILVMVAVGFLIRLVLNIFRKFREDGVAARKHAKGRMRRGEPVEISIFNGLLTFSYGGKGSPSGGALSYDENAQVLLLPEKTGGQHSGSDIVSRLKQLSELKNQGIVNEEEFQTIKAKLIQEE